jgi:HAD superfamily hydrolase (TIGR01549 family)
MQFKAVVFDMGDTLILTDRWDYDKCLMRLFQSLQNDKVVVSTPFNDFKHVYFEVRNQMYLEHEPTLREVDFSQRIASTLKRLDHELSIESPVLTRAIEAFINAFIEDLRIDDYTPSLLTELKKDYKLGMVSNFAYAPGIRKMLQHFNLTRFFDSIVVSGELGLRKPHPKIFEEILKKLKVKAAEAVFVGDSLKADIYGAKRMGFNTVLVENAGLRKNPYAVAGELDPFPVEPDAKVSNLRKLPETLKSL